MCNKDFDLMKFRLQLYYALSQVMPHILAYGCITMRQHDVYIWPWPLTWVAGVSLASFTNSFYLIYYGPKLCYYKILIYYGKKNFGTIPKTMEFRLTMKKNYGSIPKNMEIWLTMSNNLILYQNKGNFWTTTCIVTEIRFTLEKIVVLYRIHGILIYYRKN